MLLFPAFLSRSTVMSNVTAHSVALCVGVCNCLIALQFLWVSLSSPFGIRTHGSSYSSWNCMILSWTDPAHSIPVARTELI